MSFWTVVSSIIGWIYFFAWSASFYGQLTENYKRKSVEGYKLDFQVLNLTGFSFYCFIYVSGYIGNDTNPYENYGMGKVQVQDMLFAVHALIIVCVTGVQCLIYPRGKNKVTDIVWVLIALYWISAIFLYFTFNVFEVFQSNKDMNFYLLLGYLKLSISVIKYIPPAYWNYQRKSTVGWSIVNILLDFTGGLFSITQTVIDTLDGSIASSRINPIKFGLGNIAMLFDILFMVQHYILYPEDKQKVHAKEDSVLDKSEQDNDAKSQLLRNETP